MIAVALLAFVLGVSAVALVVLPLVRPVPDAWLVAEARVWFGREPIQPSNVASPSLRLDSGEDLRTGKLDARDYGLLLEGDHTPEEQA